MARRASQKKLDFQKRVLSTTSGGGDESVNVVSKDKEEQVNSLKHFINFLNCSVLSLTFTVLCECLIWT